MQTAIIKAIETNYDGYRFRSRLEARWAVFFHEVGIGYEYESEGFRLPSGALYLPDFYIPEFDAHIEIKPNFDISFADLSKMFELSQEKNLILICGVPGKEAIYKIDENIAGPVSEQVQLGLEIGPGVPTEDQWVEARALILETLHDFASLRFSRAVFGDEWAFAYSISPPSTELALGRAIAKARGARFEHGEKP